MVFGALLSGQDGVPIENAWDRADEDYLAILASTHHYRILKKWVIMDRNGVYGLMGHVQRNRHVKNLLGDSEYAQATDAVSSIEADQLRKCKFEDDRGKSHVVLVSHLVQANLKPQEMDTHLLKVPKATLQKQMHSVSQGIDQFQDSPTSMLDTRVMFLTIGNTHLKNWMTHVFLLFWVWQPRKHCRSPTDQTYGRSLTLSQKYTKSLIHRGSLTMMCVHTHRK